MGQTPIPYGIDFYTAMPYNLSMEFIEATLFTKYVYSYLTDDEYLGLQSYLLQHPESGKVVPGSGGVRKLRWAMTGTDKRGGVRVIYYCFLHTSCSKRKMMRSGYWLFIVKAKQKIYKFISCARLRRKFKMSKRDIGQEILDGIREIKAFKAGRATIRNG